MKVMKKSIQKNENSARKVVPLKITPYELVYICAIASEELDASTFKVVPTPSRPP
jgi:hypothetical protein